MIDKYELKSILENGVASIVFTKLNGEERTLKCTLIPEYLPKTVASGQQLLNEASPREENPNTLAVWDIENGGWRSFRLDNVKNILT